MVGNNTLTSLYCIFLCMELHITHRSTLETLHTNTCIIADYYNIINDNGDKRLFFCCCSFWTLPPFSPLFISQLAMYEYITHTPYIWTYIAYFYTQICSIQPSIRHVRRLGYTTIIVYWYYMSMVNKELPQLNHRIIDSIKLPGSFGDICRIGIISLQQS